MSLSTAQFADRIVASGLLTAEELSSFQAALTADRIPQDGQDLAKELIRAGKLTRFQAAQVLHGKGKALFLGEYVLLDKIGEGGMGAVYRAQHRRMERTVALKVISSKAMQSPAAVQRFQREVKAAARLLHPNIVTAFDASEVAGTHYLVMEFVNGNDLATILKERGIFTADQALRLVIQAAQGLEYAHAQGIVHRDIKPHNLLVDRQGNVKILDMGLARFENPLGAPAAIAAELTQSGQIMGTVDYMAPEQAEDTHSADHRADIYSLGCTLYRLLTGEAPYGGDTLMRKMLAHRDAPIPSLAAKRPDVSARLDTTLRKMLAKRPEDRFQSMTDLLVELRACQITEPPSPPVAAPAAREGELTSFLASLGSDRPSKPGAGAPAKPFLLTGAEKLSERAYPTHELSSEETLAPLPVPRSPVGKILSRNVPPNRRRLIAIAGGCGLAIALSAVLIVWAISGGGESPVINGQVTMQAEDKKAQELLTSRGIRYVEVNTEMEYTFGDGLATHPLPPGEYRVVVPMDGDKPALTVEPEKFTISKTGGQQTLIALAKGTGGQMAATAPIAGVSGSDQMLPGRWYDLLAATPTASNWLRTNEGVFASTPRRNATIRIPVEVDGSYELHASFTRKGGEYSVNVGFPAGGALGMLFLDTGQNGNSTLGSANGPSMREDGNLESGRRYDLLLSVEIEGGNATLDVRLDGKAYLSWAGPLSQLSTSHPDGLFSLSSYDGDTVFHELQLRLLDGQARLTVPLTGPIKSVGELVVPDVRIGTRGESLPGGGTIGTPGFALSFDGKTSHVTLPVSYDGSHPLTVDAWVNFSPSVTGDQIVHVVSNLDSAGFGLSLHGRDHAFFTFAEDGNSRSAIFQGVVRRSAWLHLAGVYDGADLRVFVDGKPAPLAIPVARYVPSTMGMVVGGNPQKAGPPSQLFCGLIRELRISKIARFKEEFTPDDRLEGDQHTLALYHFDEGIGDELRDSSGNNRHGKIIGATWVQADGLPIAVHPPKGDTIKPAESWVDVLTLIDLNRDVPSGGGTWNRFGGRPRSPAQEFARVAVPVAPGAQYSLRATFTRLAGNETPSFCLPLVDRQVLLVLDGWGGKGLSGLQSVNGQEEPDPTKNEGVAGFRLESGKIYSLEATVNRLGDNVTVDAKVAPTAVLPGTGSMVMHWSGKVSELSLRDERFALADVRMLGLGAWKSTVQFLKLELRVMEGEAIVLRPAN